MRKEGNDVKNALEVARHHSLKAAALIYPAFILLSQIEDRHWALRVASTISFLVFLELIIFDGACHSRGCCPRCRTYDSEELKRLSLKVWSATGKVALPCILLILAGMITFSFVEITVGEDRENLHVSWRSVATYTALAWFLLLLYSAYRFRSEHDLVGRRGIPKLGKIALESLRRIGHQGSWWISGASVAIMLAALFAPNEGIWNVIRLVLGMLTMVGVVAESRHSASLCEKCVSNFRMNAPEYAASHRWVFTLNHKGIPVMLIASIIALIFSGDSPVGSACTVFYFGVMALAMPVLRFHGRYQPWCPHCRHGGGGSEESETPDPVPSWDKPVPVS